MLIFKRLFIVGIFFGIFMWYRLTYKWQKTVDFIQMFTKRKYHHENPTCFSTTESYNREKGLGRFEFTPCEENCSYQSTKSNQEYLLQSVYEEMEYDTPAHTYPQTESMACLPQLFGYSKEEGEKVFPWYEYPRCWEDMKNPYPLASLNYEDNTVTLNCTGSYPGRYVLGPTDDRKLVLRHEIENLWEIKEYSGHPEPILPRHEYVFASCSPDDLAFERAVYIPRYDADAVARAKTNMDKLGLKGKKYIVLIFVVDSFSRNHFYRKLPKTVEYLNSLNKGEKYKAFDFLIHNIVGTNSVGNQAPLLGKGIVEEYVGDLNRDFAGKDALWQIYRQNGFVTFFGLESCDNSFPRKLGRVPLIDHSSNTFYCGAHKLTDFRASKTNRKQRCIGPQMSHYYVYNYTLAFSEIYEEVNQWMYIHVDAAHEVTGQHAQTLDDDTVEFLQKFFAQNEDKEIVIFLEGDHGMRYGDWFKSVEAFQENRLSAFFVIASHDFLQSIPGSYDTLEHNSKLLNSKYDMRKTLIWLSGLPYGLSMKSQELFPCVNMFTEKANSNRTCQEIGIPPWHWSCLMLETIDKEVYDPQVAGYQSGHPVTWEVDAVIQFLAKDAVEFINIQDQEKKSKLCQKLTLRSIENVYAIQLDNSMEEFKLVISVEQSETARFEVTYILSAGRDYLNYDEEGNKLSTMLYYGQKKRYKVLYLNRLDKYQGICEWMAREEDFDPETCICHPFEDIKAKYARFGAFIEEKYFNL